MKTNIFGYTQAPRSLSLTGGRNLKIGAPAFDRRLRGMTRLAGLGLKCLALPLFTTIAPPAAQAAGALALGSCDASGYSYGLTYDNSPMDWAIGHALQLCAQNGGNSAGEAGTFQNCTVVQTIEGSCLAFSVSRDRPCGATGWAYAPTVGTAENMAINSCREHGGQKCGVVAARCDQGNTGGGNREGGSASGNGSGYRLPYWLTHPDYCTPGNKWKPNC